MHICKNNIKYINKYIIYLNIIFPKAKPNLCSRNSLRFTDRNKLDTTDLRLVSDVYSFGLYILYARRVGVI